MRASILLLLVVIFAAFLPVAPATHYPCHWMTYAEVPLGEGQSRYVIEDQRGWYLYEETNGMAGLQRGEGAGRTWCAQPGGDHLRAYLGEA